MAKGEDRDLLDIIPERYEDDDGDSRKARAGARLRTSVTMIVAVLAVGGIVAAGWRFLGTTSSLPTGVPVIKADERPLKVRPDDRGGMQVPNQDKLVYERLDSTPQDQPVERLLPPPEAPRAPPAEIAQIPPPPAPTGIETMPKVKPGSGEPPAPKPAPAAPVVAEPLPPAFAPPPAPAPAPAAASSMAIPAKPAAAPPPAASTPVPAPVPAPQVAATAPALAPAPVPAPPVAKAPPAAGDFQIQLGALKAPDAAEKEWARIQKANHDLLGALKSDIIRVDLGEKGTFWRLRAGPLAESAARQLCQNLQARNQGCIVARK